MSGGAGGDVGGGLEFPVEDNFQQTTSERTEQHATVVGIRQQHGADSVIGQEVEIALEARHAAAVAHDGNAIGVVDDQAHSVTRVFAQQNLRRTTHQQIFWRHKLLAVGQLAEREFVLHVTN